MFIADAHLDLAYNALLYGRDLTQSLDALRAAESSHPCSNGRAIVTIPALQEAEVILAFGTIFVEPAARSNPSFIPSVMYRSALEAFQAGQVQLDYYHRLADEGKNVRLVTDLNQLDSLIEACSLQGRLVDHPIGIVPLMEGAAPIREPAEAELWYERGVRIIGLAWEDTPYAAGAWRNQGGLTKQGMALLETMADLGIILDLTHMSDQAVMEALDRYEGTLIASHCNARSIIDDPRQLSDRQIRLIAERDGVIGIVLFNKFLKPGHSQGDPKEAVGLEWVVAHIDHVCQCIGDAKHVGLGSDFDGGFGADDIPRELDRPQDLMKLANALREYGYETAEIEGIMGQNWINLLRRAWV